MIQSNASRAALCAMVYMMNQHLFSTWAISEVLLIPQIVLLNEIKSNGSLKVECAVHPQGRKVVVIPDEAIAKAMSLCCRTLIKSSLVTNVFPVTPGASRKNIPPLEKRALSTTVS